MHNDDMSRDSSSVYDWLLDEGRLLPTIDDVILQLGQRLYTAGVPLWRLALSIRTLHPLLTARTSLWERNSNSVQSIAVAHGVEDRSEYIGSPFQIIATGEENYRKRLCDPLKDSDHKVLHELKARGGTDYFGMPVGFSAGTGAILVFTSDTQGGFDTGDIEQFVSIARILAP